MKCGAIKTRSNNTTAKVNFEYILVSITVLLLVSVEHYSPLIHPCMQSNKLGRIHSNSYQFRHFEFQKSISVVEFVRIWISGSNLNEFDLEFNENMVKFDQI